MYLVTAGSKLDAKLCGNNAASAVSWITKNTYFHK
jgi:hypothetical protein